MKKNEAIKLFKEMNGDFIKSKKNDKIAIKTEWNNFTDSLMKDGEITESQYNNWTNLF